MIELDTQGFAEAIGGELPVVVDFWAAWCMPCKIFSPTLEQLSDELDGKVVFAKVNIDDHPDLAQKYDVASIPTLIVFKRGETLDRLVGVLPKQTVLDMLEKHL